MELCNVLLSGIWALKKKKRSFMKAHAVHGGVIVQIMKGPVSAQFSCHTSFDTATIYSGFYDISCPYLLERLVRVCEDWKVGRQFFFHKCLVLCSFSAGRLASGSARHNMPNANMSFTLRFGSLWMNFVNHKLFSPTWFKRISGTLDKGHGGKVSLRYDPLFKLFLYSVTLNIVT